MTLTKEIVEKLIELEADATPAPWSKAPLFKSEWPEKYNDTGNIRGVRLIGPYASVSCGNEAEFIISARNNLKALAQDWIAQGEEIERLKLDQSLDFSTTQEHKDAVARTEVLLKYGDAIKEISQLKTKLEIAMEAKEVLEEIKNGCHTNIQECMRIASHYFAKLKDAEK